jgi:poly(A) polymerase
MRISDDTATQNARTIVGVLQENGFTAYFAGGCVRDWLLDREATDIDIATDATPDVVEELFSVSRRIGKSFGVVQVEEGDSRFDVATFRYEEGTEDGRHPERISFSGPEEDAKRRDFTINGLFYDPVRDRVIDHVGGRADLKDKLIRTIGDPDRRFAEDYLRLLRAVRFSSVLDFSLHPDTRAAIRKNADGIRKISLERIEQELSRILIESPRAGEALHLLLDLGILQQILPEVAAMEGQEQPPQFHPEGDVFTHTMMMLDKMEDPSLTLAYSVLFHDVGKPVTANTTIEPDGSERIRFNKHANIGAGMARSILERLRLSRGQVEDVAHCVGNHMKFMEVPNMKQSTLRRLVGGQTFDDELELHRLDCLSSHGDLSNYTFLKNFVSEMPPKEILPDRWITGADIMALGIPEGPEVGHWLKTAYDTQLEGAVGSREELLDWLREEILRGYSPRM